MPAPGGEALVEHLVDRLSRAERELRQARDAASAADRQRSLLGRAAQHVADHAGGSAVELARLALPMLGTWCLVDVLVKGEASRTLVTLDPALGRDAPLLEGPLEIGADAPVGLARVLRRGRIERLVALPTVADDQSADDQATSQALRRLATGPVLVVPVVARGRVVATLTFGRAREASEYEDSDQRLAGEIAAFVALALEQRQTMETAEGAARAKAQFLTMMSHELRTPLNAIAGYAQLLEMGFRGPLTEGQRDAVTRILHGQEHLLELVDAVLTFSRLTSGRLELDTGALPVGALLDAASEPYLAQFSAQHITFRLLPCDRQVMVRADRERAIEVLRHLVANALKFTRRGGSVTLACEIGAGVVRFVVSDTGRGIPTEQLESIFHPFVQVEKGLTRSVDGTGLGLAVGRELAERMSGTLGVTSEVGVGSRFVFTLPRVGSDSTAASIDSPTAES
jgi:signal transduction histidine kinase